VAFEQGSVSVPKPAAVQRVCAVQGGSDAVALDRAFALK